MISVTKTTRALIALLAIGVAGSAFAQGVIEEIIVTATKRESSIQDVPFSINAQSMRDIQRSGATDLEELSRNVAGLTVQNLGPGQSQVAIRGVSAGQIVRDQPGVKEQVGIYVDESVISLSLFTPDLDLYDLNRVETLRGPQGTLFGSGSVGGTIRYITNQPNVDEFEGHVELDLNSLTDGDIGGHLKGMVNVPFADGKAALRLVGFTTEYAGFIDARMESTGQFKSDVNSGTRSGIRAAVTFSPSENLTITPRIIYQEVEADGFNRQEIFNVFANPHTTTRTPIQLGPRQQHLLLDEKFTDETFLADVVVDVGFSNFDLTIAGSVLERDILVSRDASALTGSVSIDVGLSQAAILTPSNLRDTTDMSQTTFEARLSSNSDGAFQWLAGVFTSKVDRDYAQRLPTPGYDAEWDAVVGAGASAGAANGIAPPDSPFASSLPYDIEQTAVFGEVSYDVNDDLTVTIGGRFYDFDEVRRIQFGGVFALATDQVDATSSDGFTPRILASWSINDNVTFNAQASQGFRLGGVNDPLNEPICDPEDLVVFGGFQGYGDETLWNYEAGIKSRFDNGVTFNAAAFYADIKDLQVTFDVDSCSSRISVNVPDAHAAGVEFELSASPTDALQFSLAGSFLESEFDSTIVDGFGAVLKGVQTGNRLASVPEFQIAGTASYYFPVSMFGGADAFVSATAHYVGDRITQPPDQLPGAGVFSSGLAFGGATGNETTTLDLVLDPYTIVNLSAGLEFDDWSATLYVHNVGDENANTSFDRERGGRARLSFRTNKPRTIGIVFRKSFSN
ncbi:MAG: TonB-dependent receptor [Proteobacteria bacterium]|nr:TonB-dependent receptor [Pseudomonadota bacterium]